MRTIFLVFIISLFISGGLNSQVINKEPLSPRFTGYSISARLDPDKGTLFASMKAFWVNHSSDIVGDIQMHMYMNAFSSKRSTFFRESEGVPAMDPGEPGYIRLSKLSSRDGADLLPFLNYISPDDGNPDDMTVVKVDLLSPVMPGDTFFIDAQFETRLPSQIIRTGYADDFFFVAQWFPKFGVYEPAGMRYSTTGGWNCHQYHAYSEFFSYHSAYDVTITLPENYVVGTGGVLTNEKASDIYEGYKTLTYRAEDIVDFAWTAWPGYSVYNDRWKHVELTLLIPPERANQVERQFTAVKNALDYFSEHVGPYPWPHLTFVDPPMKGIGAGGMEYTTLFTTISSYGVPSFLYFPESVTVHEFGHAYFMGILATNEAEEPWMDEGMTTFFEAMIMDHYYGPDAGMINHWLLKVSDKSVLRSSYISSGSRQVTTNSQPSWDYPHGTYGMMSYRKSSTWLYTLMGIIGEKTMTEIFREYYRKWAFKHPCSRDFIQIVNEVVSREHGTKFGENMNWFFDQTLYGTGLCDYRVAGIENRSLTDKGKESEYGESPDTVNAPLQNTIKAIVKLERLGEVTLPVDILVRFDNGKEILERWDGKARYYDLEYTGFRKVEWVKIDPDYRIRMDVNFINNSMTVDPDRKPVRRLTGKLISFIQFFLSMMLL